MMYTCVDRKMQLIKLHHVIYTRFMFLMQENYYIIINTDINLFLKVTNSVSSRGEQRAMRWLHHEWGTFVCSAFFFSLLFLSITCVLKHKTAFYGKQQMCVWILWNNAVIVCKNALISSWDHSDIIKFKKVLKKFENCKHWY